MQSKWPEFSDKLNSCLQNVLRRSERLLEVFLEYSPKYYVMNFTESLDRMYYTKPITVAAHEPSSPA
jgi:hypothetical protein